MERKIQDRGLRLIYNGGKQWGITYTKIKCELKIKHARTFE